MNQDASTAAEEVSRATIRVWIDFVCPYCLLGEQLIRAATSGLEVDVVWMPFELRPYPTPTLRPEDDYLSAAWKQGVYPAAERMGVAIRLPTISPQPYTRKAFLGLQYAVEHGQGDAYVDAVLRAFFQQDRDIGDTDVLKTIIQDLGLDPLDLDTALTSPHGGERHDATLQEARKAGIRAVPSVAVGGRLFSGMPQPEALRAQIFRRIAYCDHPTRIDQKSRISGRPPTAAVSAICGSHISRPKRFATDGREGVPMGLARVERSK